MTPLASSISTLKRNKPSSTRFQDFGFFFSGSSTLYRREKNAVS